MRMHKRLHAICAPIEYSCDASSGMPFLFRLLSALQAVYQSSNTVDLNLIDSECLSAKLWPFTPPARGAGDLALPIPPCPPPNGQLFPRSDLLSLTKPCNSLTATSCESICLRQVLPRQTACSLDTHIFNQR